MNKNIIFKFILLIIGLIFIEAKSLDTFGTNIEKAHYTNDTLYVEVKYWYDHTPMDNSKCDGFLYRKINYRYYALKDFLSGSPLNVKLFGAKGDGTNDDLNAIQRTIDAVSIYPKGGTVIIPKGTYRIVAKNPTITNPTRVLIMHDNIQIKGMDHPTIIMDGIDVNYLCNIDDRNSSGRDVFTAFSFVRTKNCIIEGLRFKGTFTSNENFRYQSPRAKCIGFIGVDNCIAKDIYGENILGNVINCTPSDKTYDGLYKPLNGVTMYNCHANHCWEGGFNFMGNTFNGKVRNCSAIYCQNGFEGACNNFEIDSCIFENNRRTGMAISGIHNVAKGNICRSTKSYTDSGEILKGIGVGIQIAAGNDILISDNISEDNASFGLYIYPGIKNVTVIHNKLQNNANYALYKFEIYLQNLPNKRGANIHILDNIVINDNKNINTLIASNIDNFVVTGNQRLGVNDLNISSNYMIIDRSCKNVTLRNE